MRLLRFVVQNLPDTALWSHPPKGLKRQLLPPSICSTTTTISLPTATSINSVTSTYMKRDIGSVCTTTVNVNVTTVTSINSLTSTYVGPSASQSSPPVRHFFLSLCSKLCSANMWGMMCPMELFDCEKATREEKNGRTVRQTKFITVQT
jgi:hypothetical protein